DEPAAADHDDLHGELLVEKLDTNRRGPPTSGTARRVLTWSATGSLLRLRDDDVLCVSRVQDPRHYPGLHLAWVPGDAVQAPGRLVERLARLEYFGRLGVDGKLLLALQNVPERRAGGAVRGSRLARFKRSLDCRRLGLLAVQLLDDTPHRQRLDRLVLSIVLGRDEACDPQDDPRRHH